MANTERNGLYIPEKILTDEQIGSTQKLVYAIMVSEVDDASVCRMSARKIAEHLHVTATAVQHARRVLEEREYIRLIPNTKYNYKILHFRKKRRDKDV